MEFESFAHYRILGKIGHGGMGSVYRALDTRLGRQVALKVLNQAVGGDPDKRDRFLQEARAAAALNHPNIAIIHSVEEDRGALVLVLEYIEGETLDQMMRRRGRQVPVDEAASVAAQVADALAAAHRRGIIHRDIKSSNIMLAADGRPKVLDFGIAKIADSSIRTEEGTVIGTLDYMSPEQALGETVDHRTDVWSLGVVLHELLTGMLPFPGPSRSAVLYKIVHAEPELFTSPPGWLAPPLIQVLRRALSKDRNHRYASAESMRDELRNWETSASASELHAFRSGQTATVQIPRIAATTRSELPISSAERRQITFLCCEMGHVQSGGQERDPEEFAGAIVRYRRICERVVQRCGGYMPGWSNNGAMVYFGYPVAHEDDARRALWAGLEILEEAKREKAAEPIGYEVRLGVSTSMAIVQTSTGGADGQDSILGEGAMVARALSQMAASDGLLVDPEVRRLAQSGFTYRELGLQQVPGIGREVQVSQVLDGNRHQSRWMREPRQAATPLVGRSQELGLLVARWNQAQQGNGQVVLVAGTAGIGKSRLIHELKRLVAHEEGSAWIECYCSPYYTSNALFPVLNVIERMYLEGDTGRLENAECAARLEGLLREFNLDEQTYLPVLAPLLGITPTGQYHVSEMSADRQRVLAMDALVSIALGNSNRQPTLLIVEDAHWADPSTIELLGTLIDYVPGLPLMIVLTHRPEFISPWPASGHICTVSVNRLSHDEVVAVATAVAGGGHLQPEVLEQVVRNSDGVPLFIEELSKMVVESGLGEHSPKKGTTEIRLAIPRTLRESFMARLDRLGEAKYVAQIASVLGREFPATLLNAVAAMNEVKLRASIDALVKAEVLYRRGTHTRQSYVFKHALLQDAAYESLVRNDRISLHKAAAHTLEKDTDLMRRQPEVAAYHFEQAALYPEAIEYWYQAGLNGVRRSAHREAIAALRHALEIRKHLPAGPDADAAELKLVTTLGPSLIATMGFGASEPGQNFDRALELCASQPDSPMLLPALFGASLYNLVRGDLKAAGETAERLVQTGEGNADDHMRVEGYWIRGDVMFWHGRLPEAQENFEKTVEIYDADKFQTHAHLFTQDPAVAAQCYLSFTLMVRDDPSAAVQWWERALELARKLKHSFSIGWALGFRPTLCYFGDDPVGAVEHADIALEYCTEEAYVFWITSCQAAKGWGLSRAGRHDEGLPLLRTALAGMKAIGSDLIIPLFSGLYAESLTLAGEAEQALAVVEPQLQRARAAGAKTCEIDLHRIHGDVLLALRDADIDAARACYERSAKLAEEAGAGKFCRVARARLSQLESRV